MRGTNGSPSQPLFFWSGGRFLYNTRRKSRAKSRFIVIVVVERLVINFQVVTDGKVYKELINTI